MAALEGRKLVELVDLADDNEAGVSPPIHDDHTVPEVIPMEEDSNPEPEPMIEQEASPSPKEAEPELVQQPKPLLQIQPTKKKIDVKDVFNQDDDDLGSSKRKRLPPLPPITSSSTSKESATDKTKKSASSEDKVKIRIFPY
jgi:hypothetical protein